MENLISEMMQALFDLAVSPYYRYATGSIIIVGVFALVYRLTGKAKR